jgi:putative hemolysin
MSLFDFVLFFVALVGSGFYSGMETGIVSINRLRLQHMVRNRIRGATILQEFLMKPDHLLGTTLVGTNICNTAVSVALAGLAVRSLGAHGLWLASLGSTIILLIFGEYLPKAWFRSYPAYRSLPFARALQWSGYLFYPISVGVTQLARVVIPAPKNREQAPWLTREEFAHLTKEGEQTGALSSDERRMIHSVLELTRKRCRDIMIPRDRMIVIPPDMRVPDIIALAREKRISRLPIYDEEQDMFIGITHILDLLTAQDAKNKKARDFARPPQYVDGDTPVDRLLPRMSITRQPMALVTDEKSRVIGLITTEDILEEIVGDL